jgi:hypothetical protein
MNYTRFRALLIDIDDTIVRMKRGVTLATSQHADHWSGSLLEVMQIAGGAHCPDQKRGPLVADGGFYQGARVGFGPFLAIRL